MRKTPVSGLIGARDWYSPFAARCYPCIVYGSPAPLYLPRTTRLIPYPSFLNLPAVQVPWKGDAGGVVGGASYVQSCVILR